MTDDGGSAPPGITLRPYRPADHNACRRLWAELVEHRAQLYQRDGASGESRGTESGGTESGTAQSGGAKPGGAGFEEYLTRLDLSGMWVAECGGEVVAFVGLTLDGSAGAVDPVVVTREHRGHGIGRSLLATVANEARRRGLRRLTVSPSVRDREALRRLRAAGFGSVSSVTLSYPLTRGGRSGGTTEPLNLYDLRFHS